MISTAFLVGVSTFAACLFVLDKKVEKKLNGYYIVVDPAERKIYIRCNSQNIPLSNFKVYTRMEHSKVYLYTKGAVVTANNDIVTVEHKYCLKNVPVSDLQQMTWSIDTEDKFVVEIPISDVNRKIAIKRVK